MSPVIWLGALAISLSWPLREARASLLSNVDTVQLEQQLMKIKVEKVARWYASMGQTVDAKALEVASVTAEPLTSDLGKNDTRWISTSAAWRRVHGQLTQDIYKDMAPLLARQKKAIEKTAMATFAEALTVGEVDALSDFAQSKVGRRYWALSARIAQLTADTLVQLSDGDFVPFKTTPAADELKSWERILGASNHARFVQATIESDPDPASALSGPVGIKMLWSMVLVAHSDELRKLATEYQTDLAAFDEFNASTVGRHQIAALVKASAVVSDALRVLLEGFEVNTGAHQKVWKQRYVSASAEPAMRAPEVQKTFDGGWLPVPVRDEKVRAVAQQAVALNARETGARVKLVAIQAAALQVADGTRFRLTMKVSREGKAETVEAVIWVKPDGSVELSRWTK